jgi:RNA polymerase sigma-70 factor (ECF subfamily)
MEKAASAPEQLWFRELYATHFRFVWRTLRHLGVREADLSDACQDVFIVVHRRYPSFEARSQVTTWLFQICIHAARDRRRRLHARTEVLGDEAVDRAFALRTDPLRDLEHLDKLALFEAALDNMEFEQRTAFVLFEIEGMTGPEAAEAMAVPLGTAYSRLRLARDAFLRTVERARKSSLLRPARGGSR